MALTIRILDDRGEPDRLLMGQLRRDLDRHVGAIDYASGPPADGAKGDPVIMAFVVAVLNAKAVVALVEVLKAYIARDRSVQIEVEGPGGKARFMAADAHALAKLDIKDRIEAILKPPSDP